MKVRKFWGHVNDTLSEQKVSIPISNEMLAVEMSHEEVAEYNDIARWAAHRMTYRHSLGDTGVRYILPLNCLSSGTIEYCQSLGEIDPADFCRWYHHGVSDADLRVQRFIETRSSTPSAVREFVECIANRRAYAETGMKAAYVLAHFITSLPVRDVAYETLEVELQVHNTCLFLRIFSPDPHVRLWLLNYETGQRCRMQERFSAQLSELAGMNTWTVIPTVTNVEAEQAASLAGMTK